MDIAGKPTISRKLEIIVNSKYRDIVVSFIRRPLSQYHTVGVNQSVQLSVSLQLLLLVPPPEFFAQCERVDQNFFFRQGKHSREDFAMRLEVEVLGQQGFGCGEDRTDHGLFRLDALGRVLSRVMSPAMTLPPSVRFAAVPVSWCRTKGSSPALYII